MKAAVDGFTCPDILLMETNTIFIYSVIWFYLVYFDNYLVSLSKSESLITMEEAVY